MLDRWRRWWPEVESLKKQLTCKNPKFGKKLNGHENKRSNLRFVKHLRYITGQRNQFESLGGFDVSKKTISASV